MTANVSRGKSFSWGGAVLSLVLCSACGGNHEASRVSTPVTQMPAPLVQQNYSGPRSQYHIVPAGDVFRIIDTSGKQADGLVSGKAVLVFDDLRVSLQMFEALRGISGSEVNTIIDLYIAFFNRIPDAEGLLYWITQRKAGMSVDQIAQNFYLAAIAYSSLTSYSVSMTNDDFVKIIYQNVLGRSGLTAPSYIEVKYWSDELKNGRSRASLINAMLVSARSLANDAQWSWVTHLLDNKVEVARNYALEQGVSLNSQQENISKGMAVVRDITAINVSLAKQKIVINDPQFNLALDRYFAASGANQTVTQGAKVKLNASESFVPFGRSIRYQWQWLKKPNGSQASLSNDSSAQPEFIADTAGQYSLALTVTDGVQSSAASQVSVTATGATQSSLSLYLAGGVEAVEETAIDVIFHGTRAGHINSVSLVGQSCSKQSATATNEFVQFTCQTPSSQGQDQRMDYLRVSADDQAESWNSGPIYTSSRNFWRTYNGEMLVTGLAQYLYPGQVNSGAIIDLKVNALSGNLGDIGAASYYGSLKVGDAICPQVAGVDWRYQCPVMKTGTYSVHVQHDQNTRYIVGQTFQVYISSEGAVVSTPVVNGSCGSAHQFNGTSRPSQPSELCSAGTPSTIAGNGPWTWSCMGSGGGSSQSCTSDGGTSLPNIGFSFRTLIH